MPDPEHPPSHIEIPYVPKPKYPEYMAPSDNEAPLEDHPLPADASPIAVSPDYVVDSNPEEDPEDDQADYPADEGDGDDKPSDDMILTMRIQRRSPLRRMTRKRRSTQLWPT
nr:hypothetical protein [Tanacetum cinerariifolium]